MAKHSTPKRKYTPEFKADILHLVANGEPILSVAQKMGISDSIIHAWRAAAKRTKGERKNNVNLGRRSGNTTSATPPNRNGTRYFKKSCRHFQPNDLRVTYQFIQQQEPDFPVRLLCNTLEVSKSSYYQYRAGATFQPSQADQQMSDQVQNVFCEAARAGKPPTLR